MGQDNDIKSSFINPVLQLTRGSHMTQTWKSALHNLIKVIMDIKARIQLLKISYRSFGNSLGSVVLTVMIDNTLSPALTATPPVNDARS